MIKSETIDGVQEVTLDSWKEYYELVLEDFSRAPAFVYRGQAKWEWLVESSLDRHRKQFSQRKNLTGNIPPFFHSSPMTDDEHLLAFRNAIRGRRGPNPHALTDDECWALGQHEGLKTPLLDWTRSPFVALFFAFEEARGSEEETDSVPDFRAIFAVSNSTLTGKDSHAPNDLRIVSSMNDANARLLNQSGLFLWMPHGRDIESHVKERHAGNGHAPTLIKVRIPNEERSECLVALNKMNINYMTLFPDLNGAARHVNSMWQPGHEDSLAYV